MDKENNEPNNTMNNKRPTPITDDAFDAYDRRACGSAGLRHKMAQLERERDEAREQLKRTLDELYEEQQSHGKTKGNLTERQIERDVWCLKYSKVVSENKAMREAIKKAHETLMLAPYRNDEALAKLQPFLA